MISSRHRSPDGHFDGLVFGDVAKSFASSGSAAAASVHRRLFNTSAVQQPLNLCNPKWKKKEVIDARNKEWTRLIDELPSLFFFFFYIFIYLFIKKEREKVW